MPGMRRSWILVLGQEDRIRLRLKKPLGAFLHRKAVFGSVASERCRVSRHSLSNTHFAKAGDKIHEIFAVLSERSQNISRRQPDQLRGRIADVAADDDVRVRRAWAQHGRCRPGRHDPSLRRHHRPASGRGAVSSRRGQTADRRLAGVMQPWLVRAPFHQLVLGLVHDHDGIHRAVQRGVDACHPGLRRLSVRGPARRAV
ncbi:hypothetical protein CM49_00184 [Paenibacillus sp. P1XP2]|nr:hypothetical protein CM49_00184 [Paenibacillus sp. P1XP2]